MPNNKIIFKIDAHEETETPAQEYHLSTDSQIEGSRIISGCFASGLHSDNNLIPSHKKNLIYTLEIASASKRREKVIRFSIYD